MFTRRGKGCDENEENKTDSEAVRYFLLDLQINTMLDSIAAAGYSNSKKKNPFMTSLIIRFQFIIEFLLRRSETVNKAASDARLLDSQR